MALTLNWNTRNTKPTTRAWNRIQRAVELAWGLYDDVQIVGHCERDLFLPLAIKCCKVVHCLVLIPSMRGPDAIPAGNLPPLFAKSVEDLLLILQGIRDQFCALETDQQTTRHRIEQFQRDLSRLERIFNVSRSYPVGLIMQPQVQSPPAGGIALPMILDVASRIYTVLLLHIPSLYSSRIHGIHSRAELQSEFEMQYLVTQPGDNPGTRQSKLALESWITISQILVKEWAALRILSSLVLATIFSIFQISGLWENQAMMVAAIFSLAALVYGAVLTIYVNGWRDDSGIPAWVKSTYEPFKIGFLWNTWILLGLPAIWTAWGAVFFFFSSMMVWISAQADHPGVWDSIPSSPGEPTPPRSAIVHPWFILLFAVAAVYLVLMIYTLWGLSRTRQRTASAVAAV